MRQSEALGHLYKAKLEGNSNIDSALFQATEHVDISKFHHQGGLKEKDRIESFPGQPKVEFSQYIWWLCYC
jgi:serine carboxypeptidase-like clade 2